MSDTQPSTGWTKTYRDRAHDRALRRLARRVQRRLRRGPGELPPIASMDAAHDWSDLLGAVITAAAVGAPELGLLGALVGVNDAQNRMLESIKADVVRLCESPFRTGVLRLAGASQCCAGDEFHRRHLLGAEECFYQALSVVRSSGSQAVVEAHLGYVYLALDRRTEALEWLGSSYKTSLGVLAQLAGQVANVRLRKWVTATAITLYAVPVVVVGKARRIWRSARAQTALEEFVPFMQCVAESYNSLVGANEHRTPVPVPHLSDAPRSLTAQALGTAG